MFNLKKVIIALLALSSSASFAGVMGPAVCGHGDMTTPCNRYGWDFGFDGLYLQPSYGNAMTMTTFTDASGVTRRTTLSPDWAPSFKVEGSYHFGAGSDITLDWYYYKKNTSHNIVTGTAALPVPMRTEFKPKWDAVNLEYGQQLDFGPFKHVRLHGGVEYSRISTDFFARRLGLSVPVDEVFMKYSGLGPRAGADMAYVWNSGFGVYANAATSLLIGNQSFNTLTTGIISAPGILVGSKTAIIPEIEGKLGTRYTYAMPQGDLSFDLGYIWLNYFRALNFYKSSAPSSISETDFSLQGPYLGVKYLGYI